MKRQGVLIVVSSPSGGGKTTICEQLLKQDRNLVRSISVTTREPRGCESQGRDYYYMDMLKFRQLKKQAAFLEWAQVHGHCYGTLRQAVAKEQQRGKDVLLVIDVQGGMAVKKKDPRAALIFVQPPTLKALQSRLQGRGTDGQDTIRKRLQNARWEMSCAQYYDYVVVNEYLPKAVEQVQAIITAERLRVMPTPKSRERWDKNRRDAINRVST